MSKRYAVFAEVEKYNDVQQDFEVYADSPEEAALLAANVINDGDSGWGRGDYYVFEYKHMSRFNLEETTVCEIKVEEDV